MPRITTHHGTARAIVGRDNDRISLAAAEDGGVITFTGGGQTDNPLPVLVYRYTQCPMQMKRKTSVGRSPPSPSPPPEVTGYLLAV